MNYTITHNAEYNGVEITFSAKPAEAVREALKALKFRWHAVKKLWYGRATAEAVKAAIEAAGAGTRATTETTTTTKKTSKPYQDHIRIFYNGIKVDGGKLIRCWYSLDNNRDHAPSVSITARDYDGLPRDLLPVTNGSDTYTDYFERDHAYITPAHPLYKYFRFAAEKAADRDDRAYIKYCEKRIAENPRPGCAEAYESEKAQRLERIAARKLTDPGQPTAADLAEIDRQAQEAENARREAEHAADLARREQFLNDRNNGRRLIEAEAAAHPVADGAPRVIINWSEHPAFPDDELSLSIAAAENILKKIDDEVASRAGYFKTSFTLEYTDENGSPATYTGRYDLGDGDGGLIAHVKAFVEWNLTHNANGTSKNPDDIEAYRAAKQLFKVLDAAKIA